MTARRAVAKRSPFERFKMPLVLAAVLIVLVVLVFLWASLNIVRLILMLFIAGLVGWLADAVVPGRLPWGWLGTIAAGLAGSWLGVMLIGARDPVLAGIPLIPAFLGAVIVALIASAVARYSRRS